MFIIPAAGAIKKGCRLDDCYSSVPPELYIGARLQTIGVTKVLAAVKTSEGRAHVRILPFASETLSTFCGSV